MTAWTDSAANPLRRLLSLGMMLVAAAAGEAIS